MHFPSQFHALVVALSLSTLALAAPAEIEIEGRTQLPRFVTGSQPSLPYSQLIDTLKELPSTAGQSTCNVAALKPTLIR